MAFASFQKFAHTGDDRTTTAGGRTIKWFLVFELRTRLKESEKIWGKLGSHFSLSTMPLFFSLVRGLSVCENIANRSNAAADAWEDFKLWCRLDVDMATRVLDNLDLALLAI